MAAMLGDVQRVHAFEVAHMARRGRTFQWRGEEVEEVKGGGKFAPHRPAVCRARRAATTPRPSGLGFQNGLLLFTYCTLVMLFAVPALVVVLVVIYSVIFG